MTTITLTFDEFQQVIRSVERKDEKGRALHVIRVFDHFAFNPKHMGNTKSLSEMRDFIEWGLKHSMNKKLRAYLAEMRGTVKAMRWCGPACIQAFLMGVGAVASFALVLAIFG